MPSTAGPPGIAGWRREDRMELLGGVKLELCWIPPGEFQMGDANSDEDDEKPFIR